ncbi:ATP-binding cassette domain-containing protein [Pseudonocardia sichuanensis]
MSAVLAVSALGKSFDGSGPAFRDLDMTVHAGDLVVVTGGRGSGKTSVVRCLSGTYLPSSGDVVLTVGGDRCDLATAPPRTRAWVRRHHLATFDGPLVAPASQTVGTAVARAAGVPREDAVLAVDRLGTARFADVALGRLRPAQRHAVALAAALASRAAVILLDEPESVADPDLVGRWLDERRADGAAVVVAARPGSASHTCATTVLQLSEGQQR